MFALISFATSFLTNRIGIAFISLLFGLAVGFMSQIHNGDIERLKAENAAIRRDVEAASLAKKSAETRLEKVAAEAFSNTTKVAQLEFDLNFERSRPAPEPKVVEAEPKVIVKTVPKVVIKTIRSCPMNDEEVRRLKEIQ